MLLVHAWQNQHKLKYVYLAQQETKFVLIVSVNHFNNGLCNITVFQTVL